MALSHTPPLGRAIGAVVVFVVLLTLVRAVAKENAVVEALQNEPGKYAAFAELDSTISKMTVGTFTVRLKRSGGDAGPLVASTDATVAAAEDYVSQLEAMELDATERGALARFKAGWAELMEMHYELTGSEHVSQAQLLSYWEKANALSDVTDGVLNRIVTSDDVPASQPQ